MKRPACLQRQTGACRRCGLAVSQPCRGHEEPVETTDAFRPTGGGRGAGCTPSLSPTDEAINPNRQTSAQRVKRSTPTARRVSSDGSDQLPATGRASNGRRAYHSNRRTWTEDEGPASTPSFRSVLPAKDQRQLRFGSIPSWETGGERIILRSDPCNRDHAPRVSMVGNLGKSLTAHSLSTARDPQKRACDAPFANRRKIVH